jgi:hypothetical protein
MRLGRKTAEAEELKALRKEKVEAKREKLQQEIDKEGRYIIRPVDDLRYEVMERFVSHVWEGATKCDAYIALEPMFDGRKFLCIAQATDAIDHINQPPILYKPIGDKSEDHTT